MSSLLRLSATPRGVTKLGMARIGGRVSTMAAKKKAKKKAAQKGLYANIHAKRERIKRGSGEKMRKPGSKGAPTAAAFKRSAKTAKKRR